MNKDAKQAKIEQFLNDEQLVEAVFEVFRDVFLRKSKDRDVQNLASRFIAIELLAEAEVELEKFRGEKERLTRNVQIGL